MTWMSSQRLGAKAASTLSPRTVSLKQIVTAGFWPGSPTNFLQLFDQDFFEYWDIMQKRMPGVSERSFVMGLQDFSSNKGRV